MKRLELAGRRGGDTAIGDPLGISGRISFHERGDRDESGALVTSAINRSLLAGAARAPAVAGILVTESRPRGRRRALALVFRDEPEVIGCDGGPDSDDDADADVGDDDERAEPSEALAPEERAFLNLTKRNTDFNSINSNLTGASRTLVDWVDENDRTTERSALTGRHKKFTPVVCVAPFSTGRGPGPLKVNPVAPMQNGEVVPSERRRQEMVEKRAAKVADRVAKREERVTRLDEKVTKLDDKVTRLDDKVTQLDESPKSSGDEGSADASGSGSSGPTSAKTKASLEVKPTDVKPVGAADAGRSSATEGKSQPRPGFGPTATGAVEPVKPGHKRAAADRNGAATVESGDVTRKESAPGPPMSNIDLIKSRLAEKAAQKGVSSWRSPGKHPERNLARLNSLDGVPKSPKLKSRSETADSISGARRVSGADRAKSPPRAFFPGPVAEPRAPVCDVSGDADPAGGVDKNGENASTDTKQEHLRDRDRSWNTVRAEPVTVTEEAETDASTGVKPAPGAHKPPIVNDKPKLTAKPGKVKALSHHTAGRKLSLETGGAHKTAASSVKSEVRAKLDMRRGSKSSAEVDMGDNPAMDHSKRPAEPEKPLARLTNSLDDEQASRDDQTEDSHQETSSYSPKSSMHKDVETKANLVETKTQRAMKREKELERQREELEKRNREEKKTLELSEPVRSERRPSATSQEAEPSTTRARRDAPRPGDSPPSHHNANGNGSGLYSQINKADRRRASRDAGIPLQPAPEASLPPAVRAERPPSAAVEPAAAQRSSFSTDDDDDDDEPPAPPKRTLSVSPRSRKRGGVSFAPGTEDPRSAGVKPRSQSVPRPGALDARLLRDEEVRARLGGDERRSRRDEPRSRGRFSLKKFLKFGRDEKRKDRDQVYGEFRAKPEIIHPIDRAGVGCVQVVGRTSEQRRRDDADLRRRRDRLVQDGTVGYDSSSSSSSGGTHQAPPRLPERQSLPTPGYAAHPSHRVASGLTPEGRPKPPPPPPPPPPCRQAGDPAGSRPPLTPPGRPPPPNPHLLSRSRDGWARPPDSDYANLAGRAGGGVRRAATAAPLPGQSAGSAGLRAAGQSGGQL